MFSKLITPQIKATRNPNRLRQLRYLYATILNTLTLASICSTKILIRAKHLFSAFSKAVNAPPLGFFFALNYFYETLKS
ncbi:MAG: hypothetical protein FWF27_03435, partial [Candidatus Bathyarchaeota archaeon]|nr:hypothetical protein [Candidatus Termiticorpusculum sp.]